MLPSSGTRVDGTVRPPRISWRSRRALRRAGRQDARAGLPVGRSVETTPALAELAALFGYACERERTSFLSDHAQLVIEQSRIEARLAAVREALDLRAEEIRRQSEPPDPRWLATRLPGEDRLTDDAVRMRRTVTRSRALEAARRAHEQVKRELDDVLVELAQVRSRLERRAQVARSRVQGHRDLTQRKAAVYRQALLRRHPQRDELVATWSIDICAIPAWAAEIATLPSEAATEVHA
jgi:hypothetical protein